MVPPLRCSSLAHSLALCLICFLLCAEQNAALASTQRLIVSTPIHGGKPRVMDRDNQVKTTSTSALPKLALKELLDKVRTGVRSTFLPSSYPERTPPGYLSYSVWSAVQDMSTQLRGVLATQRVLEGVGVGRSGATAWSAVYNFLIRDGCGMAATLAFTSAAARFFAADLKRWRLFADIMVDIGITAEVVAVHLPRAWFLPLLCFGNMCKAVCGVAAGACGGAMQLHWAAGSEDLADIHAKSGAQHTVTGSFGLVLSAILARSVSNLPQAPLYFLYGLLTVLHIGANMRCMHLIAFDSLNTIRLDMVLDKFLSNSAELPTPLEIARREPLWFGPWRRRLIPIRCGLPFDQWQALTGSPMDESIDSLGQNSYCLGVEQKADRSRSIVVAWGRSITPLQQTKAYVEASLLRKHLLESSAVDKLSAQHELAETWAHFSALAEGAGWDLTRTQLFTAGYEVSTSSGEDETLFDGNAEKDGLTETSASLAESMPSAEQEWIVDSETSVE